MNSHDDVFFVFLWSITKEHKLILCFIYHYELSVLLQLLLRSVLFVFIV